jgi:hypothetical protein
MLTKTCATCGREKDVVEFQRNKSKPGGHGTTCKQCDAARAAEYRAANKEKIKYGLAEYHRKNRDKQLAAMKARYVANRNTALAYQAKYAADNSAAIKEYNVAYCAINRDKRSAIGAARKARKLRATPGWAKKEKIEEFYYTANMLGMHTGDQYHVDHIVPLKNKRVCGLHCEANLQVLTAKENISKGNRLVGELA